MLIPLLSVIHIFITKNIKSAYNTGAFRTKVILYLENFWINAKNVMHLKSTLPVFFAFMPFLIRISEKK
jgi:hypothetical protein